MAKEKEPVRWAGEAEEIPISDILSLTTEPEKERYTIDSEFKGMIPKLSDEEYHLLEESIVGEGCHDAVTVWKEQKLLLDGHNRETICKAHDLDFEIRYISLPDRDKAEQWIIRNQLGRRNLKPDDASLLRARLYDSLKKPHGGAREAKCQNDTLPSTAESVALQTGVSERTVHRDVKFAKAVDVLEAAGIPKETVMNKVPRKAVIEAAKGDTKKKIQDALDSAIAQSKCKSDAKPNEKTRVKSPSTAMDHVHNALHHLNQIKARDPKRKEALKKVRSWLDEHHA